MKHKKAELTQMMTVLMVSSIVAILVVTIVWNQISEQTTTTAISNDPFVVSNSSCVDVTARCISSLTSFGNASTTLDAGNFSICNNDGIQLKSGDSAFNVAYNGDTINATYAEISCSDLGQGMTKTIANYIPLLLAVALLAGIAAFVKMG